jgi:hypothetical protein
MVLIDSGGHAGCAAVRAGVGEPLHASAPERARSWLLVEHPGPWPSTDFPGDLPAEAESVLEAATAAGVRPQLIRPVRERRRDAAVVMVASCRPDGRWLERRTVEDLAELDQLDVAALAAGVAPGFGTPSPDPVVLVCTHGRRDVCCARLGRPLAVLLDQQLPGRVWETTHVGGDRFAPNVVALPDGSYHGGVRPADVPALAEALTRGRVLLPYLRGRAGAPSAVQAAEFFLREHLDVSHVGDLQLIDARPAADSTCVELLAGGRRWCVHVRTRPGTQERLTSCAGDGTVGTPSSWSLVGLRALA